MDSPPSRSTRSEAPLSEDSGLILTGGSFSSDSADGWPLVSSEQCESDCDERSLSLCDSPDNFNTVKKGPAKAAVPPIEPPPQFQDSPVRDVSQRMTLDRLYVAARHYRRFASPRLLRLSPCHSVARPASRSSLTSRLSSSHNSLVTQIQTDDSSFITQAISHDTLATTDITDMYNVPFDSDIYAVPIDTIKPIVLKPKPKRLPQRKREKSASRSAEEKSQQLCVHLADSYGESAAKRHSVAGPSNPTPDIDPMHMTLHEVRKYLQTLYSSSSESEGRTTAIAPVIRKNNARCKSLSVDKLESRKSNIENNKKTVSSTTKYKKPEAAATKKPKPQKPIRIKKSPAKKLTFNLKQTFCNLFRLKRGNSMENSDGEEGAVRPVVAQPPPTVLRRALPPLPPLLGEKKDESVVDFATSIKQVKDCGWYWGPISVEAAEKLLSNEPDGSFIVRDSSDDHYIFTLTFKLNGMRHVRIEHEQGNFCFGSCTMFKAPTIVEFIENAVETSRSGRYLFFLNLRPMLGPVRVQLLYPVSRFKRVQSLQHMCRFVILKVVRKDLINDLPLPRRLLDYLNAAHYYSELLADIT